MGGTTWYVCWFIFILLLVEYYGKIYHKHNRWLIIRKLISIPIELAVLTVQHLHTADTVVFPLVGPVAGISFTIT